MGARRKEKAMGQMMVTKTAVSKKSKMLGERVALVAVACSSHNQEKRTTSRPSDDIL